jgi:hypothetical protein
MNERLVRIAPLAGVVFAVLEVAGNGSIGTFPDEKTPVAKLTAFYSAHHAGVERGGVILYWAALCLGLFAVTVWARIRRSAVHPLVAGAALLGATLAVAGTFDAARTYSTLGATGAGPTIAPAALQALHVQGAGGSPITGDGGLAIFLLAISAAGIAGRTFPRWLGWTALPLGLLQLTPIGFYADLLFLPWAIAAAVHMALRPAGPAPATAPEPVALAS